MSVYVGGTGRGARQQDRDKTGTRQEQDRDKSGARQGKDRDKIREGEGKKVGGVQDVGWGGGVLGR